MNLNDNENKLSIEEIHDDLIELDPWGTAKNGKFIGQLVFNEWLSTGIDVPIYEFNVDSLIDEFIYYHEYGKGGDLDAEGSEKAKVIIADLRRMAIKLEAKLFINPD